MKKEALIKIRDHLKTVNPNKFEMKRYTGESSFGLVADLLDRNYCGTAACVIGHSTSVFPLKESDLDYAFGENQVDWVGYSERITGIPHKDDNDLWRYLFGVNHPNSISKAIDRFNYVIENGKAPDSWDYEG
jgi:hypothetical protein